MKVPAELVIKYIRRHIHKQYSAEEKIRIVLEGLRSEDSIAELCRHEGIPQGVNCKWSTNFMEAGKRRLATDFLYEGTAAFAKSWRDLMDRITSKIEVLMKGRQT